MIRVLLHAPSLQVGGSERGLCELAARLPRTHYEVLVWCASGGPLLRRLQSAGVQAHILPFYPGLLAPAAATVQALHALRADVFHSFSYVHSSSDVITAVMAGIPRVITSRLNARHWDTERRLRDWEVVRNRYTHAVVAVSAAVARIAGEVEGITARVIYRGVDVAQSQAPRLRVSLGGTGKCLLLGMVGNLKPVKGHEVLLHAMALLKQSRAPVRLVISGADYGRLQELVALRDRLGLAADVMFLGFRKDTAPLYGALDIYVHAAHSEGLATAVLEAMAHGLPVAATDAGGTGEAVRDGETGFLVPSGDARALAEVVLALASDAPMRQRMGAAARRRIAERFSIRRMVEAHEQLYREICR